MADTQLLTYFTAVENQGGVIVRDAPKLDLDLYIANYQGSSSCHLILAPLS
jgi:COP9 signalosome complex subunit 1